MPISQDAYKSHAVHDALKQLGKELGESLEAAEDGGTAEQIERLDRFRTAFRYVQRVVDAADPVLTPSNAPKNLANHAQRASNELSAFKGALNQQNLNNAVKHFDGLVAQARAFGVPHALDDAEALAQTLSKARLSVRGSHGALSRDINQLKQELAGINDKIVDVRNAIKEQETRLDNVISNHQQEFKDAQNQREENFRTQLSELDEELRKWRDKAEAWAEEFLENLGKYKRQAEEVLEAIGVMGQTAGLGKSARREMWTARVWHGLTVLALIALGYVAVFEILPALQADEAFDWGVFAGRAFIGLTLAILASYTARQANKHHDWEEYYRNLQLQIAAIDPYLALMQDEKRDEIKAELAADLFRPREHKSIPGDEATFLPKDVLQWLLRNVKGS